MARSALVNGLLTLAAILVSVLGAEAVVRVFFPQYDVSGQVIFRTLADGTPLAAVAGRQRQFKNTGDYDVEVNISPVGFRESKPLSSADAQSIFVVGDSMAFGWGVEEANRFSNTIERLLGRKVFNIAIPTDIKGYGKLIRHAERAGAQITTVIVGLCMENDLHDYAQDLLSGSEPGEENGGTSLGLAGIKEFLSGNSSLYFLAGSLVHRDPFLRDFAVQMGLIIPNGAELGSQLTARNAIESSVGELAGALQGRRFVVLIIPSRALWMGDEEVRRRAAFVHETFLDLLRSRRIDFVDMRPDFESGGDPLRYHFKFDGHWNPSGHALAGRKLAAHIARSNF